MCSLQPVFHDRTYFTYRSARCTITLLYRRRLTDFDLIHALASPSRVAHTYTVSYCSFEDAIAIDDTDTVADTSKVLSLRERAWVPQPSQVLPRVHWGQ